MANNPGIAGLLGLIKRIYGFVDPRPNWTPTEFYGDPRLPKPKPQPPKPPKHVTPKRTNLGRNRA